MLIGIVASSDNLVNLKVVKMVNLKVVKMVKRIFYDNLNPRNDLFASKCTPSALLVAGEF